MSGQLSKISYALDAALSTKLLATSTTLASRLSVANVAFDPNAEGDANAGAPWFRSTVMPGEPYQQSMGGANFGVNTFPGIYQVDCFYPKGGGDSAALAMADTLASYFKRGSTFTSAGITIRVKRAWTNTPAEEDRWFHVPVVVSWWADVDNT